MEFTSDIELKDEEKFDKLAHFFNMFSNITRLKILLLLFEEGELSVNTIAEKLDTSQSSISHQLKNLKDYKLVGNRREGKEIFYFLLDNHIVMILDQGYKHICE